MKAETITTTDIQKKYFGETIKTLNDYDEAILGVDLESKQVCYSITTMIDIFMANGLYSFDDAVKYIKTMVSNCSDNYKFIDDIFWVWQSFTK